MAEATATPVAEATATPVAEATPTPVAEATPTPVAEATATPLPTATPTPVPTASAEEASSTLGTGPLAAEPSVGLREGVASALADASFEARLRAANAAAAEAYDTEASRASSGAASLAASRVQREYPRAEAEAALGRKASPGAKKKASKETKTVSATSRPEPESSKKATNDSDSVDKAKASTSKHERVENKSEKKEDAFERLVLGETQKEGLLAVSRAHAMCTKPLGNAFLGQTGFDEVIKRRLFEIHYKHEEQLAAGADAAAAIGMRRTPARGTTGTPLPSGTPGDKQTPRSIWARAEVLDSYREVQRQREEAKAAADRARVAASVPKIPENGVKMEFDGADYDEATRGDLSWNPAGTRRWEREHGDYVGVSPRRPETPAERAARKSAQMYDYESPILDN